MKAIVKLLKKGSKSMSAFVKDLKGESSENSVRLAVFYLVGAGILNVQQRVEVRVFKLARDWENKFKKAFGGKY